MMETVKRIGRLISSPLVLFGLFLAWFYLGSTWYPQATLRVSGALHEVSKRLNIWWDSGQGLNGFEWEKFHFTPLPAFENEQGIPLRITRTGTRNGASAGKNVVLSSLSVDGHELDLASLETGEGIERQDGKLKFTEDHASLLLQVKPTTSLRLEFPKFNYAGEVDVAFAGSTSRYDLYASNNETQWSGRHAAVVQSWFVSEQGEFTISMELPRYRIKALRIGPSDDATITSVRIQTEYGQDFPLSGGLYQGGYIYSTSDIDLQRQQHFHPHRFAFQVLLAAFLAWLTARLIGYASRFDGPKDVFFGRDRYLFWAMLLLGCTTFLFWHISVWPAIMSNDSLEVWRAAQIPGTYLGDHPPFNVIFYLLLGLIWNNPAIVPLVQNFFTSLLIAYILFTLYRSGLPRWMLVVCFLLVVSSIPVGLYTTILWKDVPFALLTAWLGFELARLYHEKRNKTLAVTKKRWFLLLCITLAIIGFRHNGILYLFLVPALLLLFGLVKLRIRTLAIVFSLVIGIGLVFFLHPKNSHTVDYLLSQTELYLDQALDQPVVQYAQESGKNYLGIFDVNQTRMQWDLVHLCMYGRYTNDFIKGLRWHDVYSYLPFPDHPVVEKARKIAWFFYLKSYDKPWVYLSWNPVYLLLLLPLCPLLFRVVPMTAVFSLSIFVPVAILVFLSIFNWRYYYFAHFSLYFLLPLILTDRAARKKSR